MTTCTKGGEEGGACRDRKSDNSINNRLRWKGVMWQTDLPWLLATYVGEGLKKNTEGERDTKRACQISKNAAAEVKVQASGREKKNKQKNE